MTLTADKIIRPVDAGRLLRTLKHEAEKSKLSGRDLRFVTDYYLIGITYNTGIRISEASALNWGNVQEGSLTVVNGKGGKSRSVYFGPVTQTLFREFRDFKAGDINGADGADHPVFTGKKGRLSSTQMHRRFKAWSERCGINPKISFHSLRHGYATRLLDEGVALSTVRDLLGHSNISITSTYLHFTEKAKERVLAIT